MKLPHLLCVGFTILSLPATVMADPVSSSNADVTATGSEISSGSYSFSTGSDLILGEQPYMEAHGLYANNTYNVGWTGQGGGQGALTANDPAYDPTGDADFLANLTDGSFGGSVPSQGGFASAGDPTSGAGYTATYHLGSGANGYSLTDIEVYSGWQDSGRYQQAYTIKYSLDTAPTTFLTLTTVGMYPSTLNESGAMTMLTPTIGTDLLTNVEDIQIDFDTVANGWTGYREIVVNGVASPEPSTFALIALGAAGLAFVLRRRGQASA